MNIRKLPIGVQSFEALRNENFLYVDKTEFVYRLASEGRQYFLSRPRRFGKSLLLSTMRAYFEGKKELFTGLKISELEKDWIKYPVFYFDFNQNKYESSNDLATVLDIHLSKWEEIYGKNPDIAEENLPTRFNYLLEAAHKKTGLGVVVLVDEYDKSLLESDSESLEKSKKLFKGFFGNLKSCDEHLKFVFITGVTKFSKVSIFSDLNQLNDISLDKRFSSICGITETELEDVFQPEIKEMAEEQNLSYEECLSQLKKMYDGYHFYQNTEGVYNPFSLINALAAKDFKSYWFETGTPTFLIQKLKDTNYNPKVFTTDQVPIDADTITDYRSESNDPLPLFYQTGYLTIKGYDREIREYYLGYPNNEVRYSFIKNLVPLFFHSEDNVNLLAIGTFLKDLRAGRIEEVLLRFKSLFARLPYSNKTDDSVIEQNFQNVIYIVFILLGQFATVEEHYSHGRADCVLQTADYVYIFEFKRDKSADEALQQIEEKKYAEPFVSDKRKILKIGANFNSKEKNIADWKVVEA
jgi:hypothetical protein